jgi:hypothetical protein
MKWTIHPAKENQTKTILSLAFIGALMVYVFIFWGPVWGAFGLIFMFIALQPYYFPTKYEVGDEFVQVKTIFATQKRKLTDFKKVYVAKNGILLSPFRRKTFLNNFRGVFLFLPRERDEIIKFIKDRIPDPAVTENPIQPNGPDDKRH